jgi:replicative DNA helicase
MAKIDYLQILKENIDRGIKGLNKGLPTGFNRLSDYISNIQQRKYITVGGATGTGKTAFVDTGYVFAPYEYLQLYESVHNLEVIYYSLEIPVEEKLAKFVCLRLWEKYKINIDSMELYSEGTKKIPNSVIPLIEECFEYFRNMQEKVLTFRASMSPDYMYKDLMGYAEKRGSIVKDVNGIVLQYIPNDPYLITQIIIDHSNLITLNKSDRNKKEAIDRFSQMAVFFRNVFNFTFIVVSQFNRGIESMDRKSNDAQEPQLSDFKETGSTQEDANIVLGLFNPFRYGIDTHIGYPIDKLKRRYRSVHILKNRGGKDGLVIGMHFMGETGKFKELPTSDDLKKNPQLLEKILKYGN